MSIDHEIFYKRKRDISLIGSLETSFPPTLTRFDSFFVKEKTRRFYEETVSIKYVIRYFKDSSRPDKIESCHVIYYYCYL